MAAHGWIALAILVIAAVLFLTRWLPLELTALAVPVLLYATGTLSEPSQALQGFGNHAVIAIAAVFVLGAGLQQSGVASLLARLVQRVGGRSEARLVLVVSVVVAVLSAFMSNAATVAVLLPAVIALCRTASVPPSRLMMPMGYAAILGGNLTLIGTAPNLLISNYLLEQAGEGLGMFAFAAVGAPIAAAGILYMMTVGRLLLPAVGRQTSRRDAHLPERLAQEYGMAHNLTRVRVGSQSRFLGKTLTESGIGGRYGVSVVLIEHRASLVPRWISPSPQYRIQLGDDLYLEGSDEALWELSEEERTPIGLPGEHHVKTVLRRGVCLAEVAVPPRSEAVGRALRELDFRNRSGLSVLSIWRHGTPQRQGLADMELQTGDALLVAGPVARVRELSTSDDFILLSEPGETSDYRKAPLALLFLAVAMVPPLFEWAPLAISAVAGALLMAGTGCVSMRDASRFVEWKVLFLIIGTLPLGEALEIHGVADQATQAVLGSVSAMGPPGVLAALFFIAALVSVTSSNAAAAVILAPVAWRAAEAIDIEPSAALLAVAYGCSCAFVVPFAHQCNLLVWVPGGYRTRDFALVGAGLSIVVAAVAVVLLSINGTG